MQLRPRECRKCKLKKITGGRGAHNQVLCRSCWAELLARHRAFKKYRTSGDTLAVLSAEFEVSIPAISQKNKYLKQVGAGA